jgi:hypothetical protein
MNKDWTKDLSNTEMLEASSTPTYCWQSKHTTAIEVTDKSSKIISEYITLTSSRHY